MNSITRHLDYPNLAANARLLRSGRRCIILCVEGSKDASLFGSVFDISQGDILVCRTKENLMKLYNDAITDVGFIYIRDRDAFDCKSMVVSGRHLIVSDKYDFEADLLTNRIGRRIILEYSKAQLDAHAADRQLEKVIDVASWIGAARQLNQNVGGSLRFEGLKMSFCDAKTMAVSVEKLAENIINNSSVGRSALAGLSTDIEKEKRKWKPEEIACGKDMLSAMEMLLSKSLRFAKSIECSCLILAKIVRISAELVDFKMLSFYRKLVEAVSACEYEWEGVELSEA